VESTQRTAISGRADARWWQARRVGRGVHGFLRTLRQIVGAPDYERYLEHLAARHPDRTPLTPREYYAEFVSRRFGGGGPPRCC
jgi:uncharacterized short protein YbdD (DUF466 family)